MICTKWCFTFRLFGFFMIGVTGTVLLIAAAVVVALRERQPASKPEAPVAQAPAEVRVKAVERNSAANVATAAPDSSRVVAIVCGADPTTADRYEARNDALRSIARRRDLPEKDVAALMAYLVCGGQTLGFCAVNSFGKGAYDDAQKANGCCDDKK